MSLAEDIHAVRAGVAVRANDHVCCVRIGNRDAQELIDRVSPRPLFVRQGQMVHTLLLDEAALPLADVYLCCDEDDFVMLAEGMTGAAVIEYLRSHTRGLDVTLTDMAQTHALIGLDGPYAWQLLADVTIPDVIGLAYMSFFDTGRFTCFRAGKTGEFGYELLVEREQAAGLCDEILAKGANLGIRAISTEAHDLCQLEAGFFNVRREVRTGLTPIELQLQWRVTRDREYPGSTALRAHRATRRVVLAASEQPMATDADVKLDGTCVGTILHAGPSLTRGGHIAVALMDLSVSHAGLSGFAVDSAAVRTLSSPAVNNRSIYIDPQRHSFATREQVAFPPLVRPAWS
jgi:glycine cleavage system aminomethyltransferase T